MENCEEFVKKIRNLRIKNIINVYEDERYDIILQDFHGKAYSHRKLGNIDIHSKKNRTELNFNKRDVFTVIFFIYLMLTWHCDCLCSRIYLNEGEVEYKDGEWGANLEYFLEKINNLRDDNKIILEFGKKDGKCGRGDCCWKEGDCTSRFEYTIAGLITPYKGDNYYINKELDDSLAEGRRE